jgi:hypothetical protein
LKRAAVPIEKRFVGASAHIGLRLENDARPAGEAAPLIAAGASINAMTRFIGSPDCFRDLRLPEHYVGYERLSVCEPGHTLGTDAIADRRVEEVSQTVISGG